MIGMNRISGETLRAIFLNGLYSYHAQRLLFGWVCLVFFTLCQYNCTTLKTQMDSFYSEAPPKQIGIIQTTFGKIVIRFFPDLAPKHVESFITLAKNGFYNGTTFHRVIPGFMIQGGDPFSKDKKKREMHGMGGPGFTLRAEFSDRRHVRGIVSAARSQNPDSAGSQFFIMLGTVPSLDGQYSVFGRVIDGMEVVDKIVATKRDRKDNPLKPVTMKISIINFVDWEKK